MKQLAGPTAEGCVPARAIETAALDSADEIAVFFSLGHL